MQINNETIKLIQSFEGLELNAYPDPGSGGDPWTIGYGTTIYPNGKKVKKGDTITQQQATEYFMQDILKFSNKVLPLLMQTLTDNQFGALLSFAYNVGIQNLKISTLLKKVNINPQDVSITREFNKWVKASGKVLPGLVRRRAEEAKLYFK